MMMVVLMEQTASFMVNKIREYESFSFQNNISDSNSLAYFLVRYSLMNSTPIQLQERLARENFEQ